MPSITYKILTKVTEDVINAMINAMLMYNKAKDLRLVEINIQLTIN